MARVVPEPNWVLADDDPLLNQPLMQEIVRQLRGFDRHGLSDRMTPAKLLDPFILTKERKQALPLVGVPDARVTARVQAFYGALAILIEQQTALFATPLVHLSNEGFGRALITVGKLVVLDKSLRDAHRFGFSTLAKMQEEADKALRKAQNLIYRHPDAAHS